MAVCHVWWSPKSDRIFTGCAVPTVIFHCSLSQARGPKAARIYSEVRQAALQRGDVQPIASPTKPTLVPKIEGADQSAYESGENGGQNILVLRDGFANFGRIYKVFINSR